MAETFFGKRQVLNRFQSFMSSVNSFVIEIYQKGEFIMRRYTKHAAALETELKRHFFYFQSCEILACKEKLFGLYEFKKR